MYNYKMVFFCIINHGASKIHTYMSRCLLHLPWAKFLRTELLGSTVHMSRYLIYKVCQGDSIESAPTSTRAFLALYFCSNNLYAVELGVCTCQWGYVWRPEGDVGVLFYCCPPRSFFRQGPPLKAELDLTGQAGRPASPGSTCRCALPWPAPYVELWDLNLHPYAYKARTLPAPSL